jgi:hypothetical protein
MAWYSGIVNSFGGGSPAAPQMSPVPTSDAPPGYRPGSNTTLDNTLGISPVNPQQSAVMPVGFTEQGFYNPVDKGIDWGSALTTAAGALNIPPEQSVDRRGSAPGVSSVDSSLPSLVAPELSALSDIGRGSDPSYLAPTSAMGLLSMPRFNLRR